MIYPGTSVGSGFSMFGTPGQDPNKKKLQDYLTSKLSAAPGTAGSYASISGQAPGAAPLTYNPFLAMLAGRPGETFDNLPDNVDSLQASNSQNGPAPSIDLGGYSAPSNVQNVSAPQSQSQQSGGVSNTINTGLSNSNGSVTHYNDTSLAGRDGQTSSGYAAQVNPSVGMNNIAGLDPSIQAALMYHIGLAHGSQLQ